MDEYQNGMLGKRNQAQKATHCTIPFTCHSGKGKTKNKADQWLPRAGYQRSELTANRHKGNFEGDKNVLYFDCGDGEYIHTFIKTHQPNHLRRMTFTIQKLYLKKP